MNRRTRCAITYNGQTIDYDFSNAFPFSSSSPTLEGHIAAICTKFEIEEDSDVFALEVCKTQDLVSYLTAGDLIPQKLSAIFAVNKKITLAKKPEYAVEELLSRLKDPDGQDKNKVLFDLGKVHVKNLTFCEKLLDFDGFRVVLEHCHHNMSGISHGLAAIENFLAFFPDHTLCSLTIEDINFLVSLIDHSNLTIVKAALRVLIQACYSSPPTLLLIQQGIITQAELKDREPYSNFLQHLETQDVSICTLTLRMLNIILSNADQQSRTETFLHLHRLGANYALKKLAHGSPVILSELYHLQKLKLKAYEDESKISYDKNNEEHERCLMLLWRLVFPNVELESRVSEQWKLMGFQGTDPATDFRGMGICGLNNLLYFAQHHTELLRKYCTEQQGRGLALYPVATAAINVSQLMFQIFDIGKLPKKDGNNGPGGVGGVGGKSGVGVGEGGEKVFLILFDVEDEHPFEEAYSIVFQLFDYTWNAMGATYMDYPNVIKAVLEKVTNLIMNCTSIAQFQKVVALEMETPTTRASNSALRGSLVQGGNTELSFIHRDVTASVINTVKNQKISIMKEGDSFQIISWGEGKVRTEQNKYRILILNEEGNALNWADISAFDPPSTTDLNGSIEGSEMNTIPLKNILDVTFGASSTCFSNFKAKFKDESHRHFTICIDYTPVGGGGGGAETGRGKERETKGKGMKMGGGNSIEIVARSKETFVSWVSGLQELTNQKMTLPELEEEVSSLVKISYELRMLDLEDFGAMIAKEPVQRPEEPDDYLFKMDDNESIMTTEDGLIPVPNKKMLVGGAGRVGVAQKQ